MRTDTTEARHRDQMGNLMRHGVPKIVVAVAPGDVDVEAKFGLASGMPDRLPCDLSAEVEPDARHWQTGAVRFAQGCGGLQKLADAPRDQLLDVLAGCCHG